ncbi:MULTISPECIES: hypothetical protein [Lentilactobacillus]|uniref:Uncharacterized protein n=2 Tax=Lentilactobacillus TaxID=2767893 RepID=A0A0R1YBW4_9LACO|nr:MULTISPECIES: hypothetical protein [Lentilactobacillus]KRM39886.1 hypothetical protein FD47_GL002986 [Lentilactobacillus parafarraginis DSM 18390 = JCM 14109]MBV0929958.1 hypothetical protein [Lentilactobacillus dabitei]
MQTVITKVTTFLSSYIQTILLILGLMVIIIGLAGILGFYIALIFAGIFLVVLALLINYEKNKQK